MPKTTNSRLMIDASEDFNSYGASFAALMGIIEDRLDELVNTLSSTEDADDIAVSDIAYTATLVGTSSNGNALAVGPNGTTNPMFKVVCSTTSAATGISITGAAAAGGVAVAVISSGDNETLNLDAKGTGNIVIAGTSTGDVLFGDATNPAFKVDHNASSAATGLAITAAAAAGGLAVAVISSGTNENLTIDAKGSGTIVLGGTSTGAITLTRATTMSAGCTISADSTLSDGVDLAIGTTNGTKIGTAAAQKIGFFNATPIVQPASASQAACTNTTTTTATTTALQADLDAVRVLANKLRTDLVALGLIKGSA